MIARASRESLPPTEYRYGKENLVDAIDFQDCEGCLSLPISTLSVRKGMRNNYAIIDTDL